MNDTIRMQLSAFVDGELPENEAELLLRRVCQDEVLRKEAAEYFAISRLIRNEVGIAGADRLHERVAAEIDERPATDLGVAVAVNSSKAVRPLVGVAIAASVALLAIFGLQQSNIVDEVPQAGQQVVPVTDINATPPALQEKHRQYFLNHANASSRQGANGISARLTTLRFSDDVVEEAEIAVIDEAGEDSNSDNENEPATDSDSDDL